ncbi:MAG TPA: hypothetical protein VLN73_04120 [Alphaproteobacteria bacterium]|nr:hypothetical protein [Alphaproteobacteria bacterium]
MTLNRWMWVFAGLFVAFGLMMAVSDAPGTKNTFGGLSIASLGSFALAMAADGILTGQIRIQFDVIERAKRPRLFWSSVTLVLAAGIVVMVGAVWVLFFKAI